jgi:CRISPR-associated Cas5-like protein
MVWIGAKYQFASTFSYRIPYFSSSYALSAPAPSPSTIKLALAASTINRTGDVEKGKQLFQKVQDANVTVELPIKIAVFKAFMKRLKKKRQERGFEKTFGIREYILYEGSIGIYLDVPKGFIEDVCEALQKVQYFGTSDSICSLYENKVSEPDANRSIKQWVQKEALGEGVVFLLSDFTEKTTFEDVNPFSGKRRIKENLTLKPYLFPIQIIQRDKNCILYQLIKSA